MEGAARRRAAQGKKMVSKHAGRCKRAGESASKIMLRASETRQSKSSVSLSLSSSRRIPRLQSVCPRPGNQLIRASVLMPADAALPPGKPSAPPLNDPSSVFSKPDPAISSRQKSFL
eukprot:5078580-Pleurochrysis_carterae.AAC.1